MTKRLFLAIELPEEMMDDLVRWQRTMGQIRGVKWTAAENLHITAAFLGEVSEEKIPELTRELVEKFFGFGSLEIEFKEVVLAPLGRKPTMIWADFWLSKKFNILWKNIWQVAGKFVTPEILLKLKKPAMHITLARFSYLIYFNNLRQPKILDKILKIREIVLMESDLRADRAYYKKIGVIGLGK